MEACKSGTPCFSCQFLLLIQLLSAIVLNDGKPSEYPSILNKPFYY